MDGKTVHLGKMVHQEDLVDRLQRTDGGRISLQDAFEGRSRGAMIGLFLAVLELARQHRIRFHQEAAGEIELELRPEEDALPPDDPPEEPAPDADPAVAPQD